MGTTERKQRELQERRDLILDAARRLFFERGYENVTVKDIASETEYGMSALYAVFPGKDDIYGGIILQGLALLVEFAGETAPCAGDLDERFLGLLSIVFQFYRTHPDHYKAVFLFNSRVFTRIPAEIIRAKLEEGVRVLRPLTELLHEGIAAGYFRPVDVPLVVTALWTAQAGMINQFISTNQGDRFAELEAHCRFSAENSLRGLKLNPGA